MKKLYRFIRSHWRWMLTVATLLLVALALRSLSRAIGGKGDLVSLSVEQDKGIGLTPAQVRSIRRIGQWEFLSVQIEEIIDTTHSRFLLPDEQLIRIYRGTVRLGVDMTQLAPDWLAVRGDTALLHLPPIRQLGTKFIDEAQTQTFYETGHWTAQARQQLYRRAERQMKKRLSASHAYEQAEENGREQVTALMRTFGFRAVEVKFEKNRQK